MPVRINCKYKRIIACRKITLFNKTRHRSQKLSHSISNNRETDRQ